MRDPRRPESATARRAYGRRGLGEETFAVPADRRYSKSVLGCPSRSTSGITWGL
jgi:hypothetical protein